LSAEIAKEFDPELRALLGYTMANYGLGYYSPPQFTAGVPGTMPPELAFKDDQASFLEDVEVPKASTF